MKFLFSVLLFSTYLFNTATAEELTYFKGTWAEAKAKAKAENKYIFVDCYTDWCGWCKVMDKETMTDPEVIKLMSEKYVAVKIDMEHGEGIKLAMKYHITGFPTFIFFNPAGTYIYTSVGYQKPKEFIDELNNARDKSKQLNAPGFTDNIDLDFPQFYKDAYGERKKAKRPEMAVVTAYLDKQTDLFSEVNWGIILRFTTNDKYAKHFFDNIKKYEQLYGSTDVNNKVVSILNSKAAAAAKAKSNIDFMEVLKLVDKYIKEDPAGMKLDMRLDYYKETNDWDNFMIAFNDYISAHGYENPDYINSVCWAMYEQCDDKKALTKAAEYMGKAVAKEPRYAAMDTYACILFKSGQVKEAEEWANKAIAKGKADGEKTESTEELLTKIKGTAKP